MLKSVQTALKQPEDDHQPGEYFVSGWPITMSDEVYLTSVPLTSRIQVNMKKDHKLVECACDKLHIYAVGFVTSVNKDCLCYH